MELNNDTRGVIVGCNINGFVSLETYGHGGKPHHYAQRRDVAPKLTAYICLPLAKGEFITAAWIRELNNAISIREPVLVVSSISVYK